MNPYYLKEFTEITLLISVKEEDQEKVKQLLRSSFDRIKRIIFQPNSVVIYYDAFVDYVEQNNIQKRMWKTVNDLVKDI